MAASRGTRLTRQRSPPPRRRGAGALSAVFILFSFARSPEAITITHTVL